MNAPDPGQVHAARVAHYRSIVGRYELRTRRLVSDLEDSINQAVQQLAGQEPAVRLGATAREIAQAAAGLLEAATVSEALAELAYFTDPPPGGDAG